MKFLKCMAAIACAAVIFTSCDDKQTAFDVYSVPGRSVLKGTVVYNQGTTVVDGKFVHNYQPAANLDLMIIVENSAYSDDLTGNSVFKTTTDENGKYEISIPAPLEKSGRIKIQSSQFEGERTYVTTANNQVSTASETVVYGVNTTQNVYMQTDGICIANLECSYVTPTAVAAGYNQYGILKGRIGRNSELYVAPDRKYTELGDLVNVTSAQLYKTYVPAPKADLFIKISDNNNTFQYNVTTDGNGDFTLSVPVAAFPANFSYDITIMPQENETYTFYKPVEKTYTDYFDTERTYIDYESQVLNGWYSEYAGAIGLSGSVYLPVAASVKNIEVKGLIFDCNNASEIGYSVTSYQSNLPWKSDLEAELKAAAENN